MDNVIAVPEILVGVLMLIGFVYFIYRRVEKSRKGDRSGSGSNGSDSDGPEFRK